MKVLSELFFFTGRTARLRFWLLVLAAKVILIVSIVGAGLVIRPSANDVSFIHWAPAIYFWIIFAVGARRLHDMDYSGWWIAPLTFVPLIMAMVGAIGQFPVLRGLAFVVALGVTGFLGFSPGTTGPNRYGPDPRAKRMLAEKTLSQ